MTPLRFVVVLSWFVAAAAFVSGDEPSRTGPQTEKRFPPLKVPAGFKATLFACDPLIEYPSVIAAGPKANQLFVAIDYMTGLGEEIIRRDEIRLVEDTDGDGYADKATVYAKGFNSIQGLAYHDGRVYVMHAPFLTVLRDTKGTGAADERRELLTGEALTQRALAQPGNAERGRAVFFNVEKSLCLKCHRVADKGEPIGPELTGIGARFGRVYLVESILDPNRAVVPGFATVRVELKDERVLTGVKVSETDTTLTLADAEGKKHEVKKSAIAAQRVVPLSTMPEGLEKRLTEQEFVDLIAYLVSLKDRGGKP